MIVRSVKENDWPRIIDIQTQVYGNQFLESEKVLKSKWYCSPDCCFVFETKSGDIEAYLLGHHWHQLTPPTLNQCLPENCEGNYLFLHDLAVAAQGKGIATQLVNHFINASKSCDSKMVMLVAVQSSKKFWVKQGFKVNNAIMNSSYGDIAYLMSRAY